MARRRFSLGTSVSSKTALKDHVKNACKSHFFDRDTMRFFDSKLESVHPGNGKTCFVTSERFTPSSGPPEPRKYTVRKLVGCKINTVGEDAHGWKKYSFKDDARAAAKACARGELGGARRRR